MFKRLTPSPAMAVALLALFVALGGGAYAAANLRANSVGTRQLRNGAVTNPKIANNAVRTAKIRNGAVTLAKLAPGARPGAGGSTSAAFASGAYRLIPHQATRQGSVRITTTAGQRHLVVSGSLEIRNSSSSQTAQLECWYTVGGRVGIRVERFIGVSAPGRTGSQQVVLDGRTAVGAGTHTVTVDCRKVSQTTGILATHQDSFTVITTG
jgi:hypothetical protein